MQEKIDKRKPYAVRCLGADENALNEYLEIFDSDNFEIVSVYTRQESHWNGKVSMMYILIKEKEKEND